MKKYLIILLITFFLIGCSPQNCNEYCKNEGFNEGDCLNCWMGPPTEDHEVPEECNSENYLVDKETRKVCGGIGIVDSQHHGCLCN